MIPFFIRRTPQFTNPPYLWEDSEPPFWENFETSAHLLFKKMGVLTMMKVATTATAVVVSTLAIYVAVCSSKIYCTSYLALLVYLHLLSKQWQ